MFTGVVVTKILQDIKQWRNSLIRISDQCKLTNIKDVWVYMQHTAHFINRNEWIEMVYHGRWLSLGCEMQLMGWLGMQTAEWAWSCESLEKMFPNFVLIEKRRRRFGWIGSLWSEKIIVWFALSYLMAKHHINHLKMQIPYQFAIEIALKERIRCRWSSTDEGSKKDNLGKRLLKLLNLPRLDTLGSRISSCIRQLWRWCEVLPYYFL